MTIFEVEVDASSFFDWAERAYEHVKTMSDVLEDIRQIIWKDTSEMIPLEWGYLENSFFKYSQIISDYPFFELKIHMTGLDNPKARGWDYALFQHTGMRSDGTPLNHPIKGEPLFLEKGFDMAEPYFMKYLETDYLTALGV